MSAAMSPSDKDAAQAADTLIVDSAARLFADAAAPAFHARMNAGELDAALWRRVADSGLPLLLASEAAGGFAQGWSTAFEVLRELGYHQLPLPLAETMVAAQLASLAGLDIPTGPLTLIEQGQRNTLHLSVSDGCTTVSGTAHAVPWARHAEAALVSLADGRVAWLKLQQQPGLQLEPHTNAAGLPSDSLLLHQVPLQALAPHGLVLAQPVWTLGALARCAMLAGTLSWVLEQSVRHAGERVQFGKPIAAYQAIQHALALLAGDVSAATMATQVAAADAPDVLNADCSSTLFSTAVAKVRCGEAASRAAGIAHQVHGAMGFTQDHPLQRATRRLWAWREEFGSDAQWAAVLGRQAIRAGSAGFWPAITQKQWPANDHASGDCA